MLVLVFYTLIAIGIFTNAIVFHKDIFRQNIPPRNEK